MNKQGRGMLSDDIQKLSNEFLGRDMTVSELRMLPYLYDCSVNNRSTQYNCLGDGDSADWCTSIAQSEIDTNLYDWMREKEAGNE